MGFFPIYMLVWGSAWQPSAIIISLFIFLVSDTKTIATQNKNQSERRVDKESKTKIETAEEIYFLPTK